MRENDSRQPAYTTNFEDIRKLTFLKENYHIYMYKQFLGCLFFLPFTFKSSCIFFTEFTQQ